MTTVAEQLLRAREAKSLTIHQVAESTKIRTDHIRALEQGNFHVFSAPVYIKGFVRAYATLLKLDVPKIMTALDEELGHTEKFREPPPLTDQRRGALYFLTLQLSKVNWRTAVIGGIVVVIVGGLAGSVIMWRHHRNAESLTNISPGIYQPSQSASGETLPLPTPSRQQ